MVLFSVLPTDISTIESKLLFKVDVIQLSIETLPGSRGMGCLTLSGFIKVLAQQIPVKQFLLFNLVLLSIRSLVSVEYVV